ncbi:hypothetical protein LLG46_04705 [bacterium]|nr:hypothetical protein [bacterium]
MPTQFHSEQGQQLKDVPVEQRFKLLNTSDIGLPQSEAQSRMVYPTSTSVNDNHY